MNNSIKVLLSVAILFLLSSCGGGKKATSDSKKSNTLNFYSSQKYKLSEILEKAEKDNKLVFVDVYTTWCMPCKMMDEYVFTDENLRKYMDKNFISYKVDAEKGNGQLVAGIYSASVFPTLLFLDTKGTVLERRDGSVSISELKNMGESANSQMGK